MKRLNKIPFPLILASVILISSCGDKNKKPVSIGLSVNTIGITSGISGQPGYLEFTTGHLYINEFSVNADRSKGDDIQFTRNIDKQVIINASAPVLTESFDVVQGDYESMSISLKISRNGNSNGLYLFGNYTDLNLITFQIQLKIDAQQFLSKVALKSGSAKFNILSDQPQYVDFSINIATLFSIITSSDWQSAQHQGGNPNTPVFIDESNNIPLFNLLLLQLPQCISVNFR